MLSCYILSHIVFVSYANIDGLFTSFAIYKKWKF